MKTVGKSVLENSNKGLINSPPPKGHYLSYQTNNVSDFT